MGVESSNTRPASAPSPHYAELDICTTHIHVQIRVSNWHKLTKTVSGNICLSPGQQFKIKSVFGPAKQLI